jgi:hypothetical protein
VRAVERLNAAFICGPREAAGQQYDRTDESDERPAAHGNS